MKILFLAKSPDATAYFRVELPCKALNAAGHEAKWCFLERHHKIPNSGVKTADVHWADVIVVQRPVNDAALDLIGKIKAAVPHTPVIGDYDDDYFSVPSWNPGYPYVRSHESVWRQCVRQFDGIMVSTDTLASAFEENGRYPGPVETIPNGFDFETFDTLSPDMVVPIQAVQLDSHKQLQAAYSVTSAQFNELMRDRTVVAWAGSKYHYVDLDWIADDLKEVCEISEDPVFLFVGYVQGNVVHGLPVSRIFTCGGASPVSSFYRLLKSIKIDIALAPLDPCTFNASKCVGPDTLVVTPGGVARIADLVPQRVDNLITPANGQVLTKGGMLPFDGTYYGSTQACLKITTASGYEIIGTPSHRLSRGGKWASMADLHIGDDIDLAPVVWPDLQPVEVAYPMLMHKLYSEESLQTYTDENAPRVRVNEDWGRFLGYLVGDGTINSYNSVGISCSTDYPDVEADVCRLFSSFGLVPRVVAKRDSRTKTDGKGRDIRVSSRIFRRLLEHMGFAGSKGKLLTVPNVVMRSPLPVVREFLRGLFESDSCALTKSCGVTFVTKSHDLAKQVQFLLSVFGVKAQVKGRMHAAQNWTTKREYFSVILGAKSARIYHEKIGFISAAKTARLEDRARRGRSNAFIDWTWTDAVTSIEPVQSEVFDISVPGARHYIGNNFINHNSNIKAMEAMAIGAYPICSEFDPYEDDIGGPCHGRGTLVDYKPGAWRDAIIDAALRTPDDAATDRQFNNEYVRSQHALGLRVTLYERFFEEAIRAKRP